MRIFLTGATGFIGSYVLTELLEKGHRVACLLRPETDPWRIEEELQSPEVEIIRGNMAEIGLIRPNLSKFAPDAIIHLAWDGIGSKGRNKPEQIYNLAQGLDLLNLGIETGITKFIGLGSQAEYGLSQNRISEDHPEKPDSLYGVAKLAFCRLANDLCGKNNISFAWLRLFSAYGPKDGPDWLIPHIALTLVEGQTPSLSACEQIWDYVHARDAAKAVVSVLEAERGEGIFNLGSGDAVALRHIVETVRDSINPQLPLGFGEIPYRENQVMHLEADIGRLKEKTGWSPGFSLDQGIAETARWYSENFKRFRRQ